MNYIYIGLLSSLGVALVACSTADIGGENGQGGAGGSSSPATGVSSSQASSASVGSTSSAGATTSAMSSSSSGMPCGPVSLANDVQPIFTQGCALTNCHTGNNPEEQLNLSPGKSYASLVGVQINTCNHSRTRVVPMDVANSYLVNKVTGANMCAGKQMPDKAPPLSQSNIDKIIGWVCEGAPDN